MGCEYVLCSFSVDYLWDIWTLCGFHHRWCFPTASGLRGSVVYTVRWVHAKELRKPRSRLEADCLTCCPWQLSFPPFHHCHQELCFRIHSITVLDKMQLRTNLTLDKRWITQIKLPLQIEDKDNIIYLIYVSFFTEWCVF